MEQPTAGGGKVSDWNDPTLRDQRDRLIDTLRGYRRVAVAFSGGIDSTVVAQAAHLALGEARWP